MTILPFIHVFPKYSDDMIFYNNLIKKFLDLTKLYVPQTNNAIFTGTQKVPSNLINTGLTYKPANPALRIGAAKGPGPRTVNVNFFKNYILLFLLWLL